MLIQTCFDCEGWRVAAVLPTFRSAITYLGGLTAVVFLSLAAIRAKRRNLREAAPYFIGCIFGSSLLLISRSEIASTVMLVIAAWLPAAFMYVVVPLWLAYKLYKKLASSLHRIVTSRKGGRR